MRGYVTIILILVSLVFFLGHFIISVRTQQKIPPNQVEQLPIQSLAPEVVLPAATVAATTGAVQKVASPSATIYPKPSKSNYVIALFGDSMVETMGENLDYLDKSLKEKYPYTKFKLYNYGIGSQNVVEGLARFHDPFLYQQAVASGNKTRNYPPIDKINADIIIISSFGYNPLSPYDRDKHWINLKNLVLEASKTGAKAYILAEIAPIKSGFGRGPGGIDWTDQMITTQVAHIIEQLDNAVGLAENLDVPLINVYERSKIDGKYGDPIYVGTHDHIHPSIEGEIFMADIITTSIKFP